MLHPRSMVIKLTACYLIFTMVRTLVEALYSFALRSLETNSFCEAYTTRNLFNEHSFP